VVMQSRPCCPPAKRTPAKLHDSQPLCGCRRARKGMGRAHTSCTQWPDSPRPFSPLGAIFPPPASATRAGLTSATSVRDWAHPCHICAGTGRPSRPSLAGVARLRTESAVLHAGGCQGKAAAREFGGLTAYRYVRGRVPFLRAKVYNMHKCTQRRTHTHTHTACARAHCVASRRVVP
jgi:hypothetical protein